MWHRKITDNLAEVLGFCVRGALMTNAIILALASIYIVAKLTWFSIRALDVLLFSKPWVHLP